MRLLTSRSGVRASLGAFCCALARLFGRVDLRSTRAWLEAAARHLGHPTAASQRWWPTKGEAHQSSASPPSSSRAPEHACDNALSSPHRCQCPEGARSPVEQGKPQIQIEALDPPPLPLLEAVLPRASLSWRSLGPLWLPTLLPSKRLPPVTHDNNQKSWQCPMVFRSDPHTSGRRDLCAHAWRAAEGTERERERERKFGHYFIHGAHGVVVSHPLSMREALGSIPSVSTLPCAMRLLAS